MKKFATIAFLGMLATPAIAQQNLAMQMLGKPLAEVAHEASQMAYLAVETCHRESMVATAAGHKVPKNNCDQLDKAANQLESAHFAILRAQLAEQSKK